MSIANPAATAHGPQLAPSASVQPIASGAVAGRILVVDPVQRERELVGRVLGRSNWSPILAAGAHEARELLARQEFDVVLCEVRLGPEESGLELAREIRTRCPGTTVVMISQDADLAVAEVAVERGAAGFLVKPFSTGQMLIEIAQARRRSSLETEISRRDVELERTMEQRTGELASVVSRLDRSRDQLVASHEQLDETHRDTAARLSQVVEHRHPTTDGHVERIGEIAALIASSVGLEPTEIELLTRASPMHDIGKVGIPDEILLKPGRLTESERTAMQRHTEIGRDLLADGASDLLTMASAIAWTHHERYDGGGYPRGLEGDEIPIEARIVSVADVFDALVHDRVYRPAFELEDALEIMREGRGTQFDPVVLDAFLTRVDEIVALDEDVGDPRNLPQTR
jgi:putative two-component system response regulator